MRTLLVTATLLLVATATARAQVSDSTPTRPTLSREEPRYPTGEVFPLFGAHYNSATGATAHLAVIRTDQSNIHGYGGWVISGDLGTDGGKLGIGRAGGIPFLMGVLARTSYMRTWGTGPLRPRQDYVGVDLRLTIFAVTVGVSEHVRVHGDSPGDGSFLAWSMGVGF